MHKRLGTMISRASTRATHTAAALLVTAVLLSGTVASARVSHGYTPIFTMHSASAVGGNVQKVSAIADIYPNPFNPLANIAFDLAEPGQIDLAIYDIAGRLICRLDSGFKPGGRYESSWNGRDEQGRIVSTGTYFARLSTPNGTTTRKMTLAK